MSATGEPPIKDILDSIKVLKGLRDASFRELAQSGAALNQLHVFLIQEVSTLSTTSKSAINIQ